ncbi:DUF2818 family protein [Andreprevotia chitinilytica]|uniref:DUF2818 family protein n=1 Tax=Andreprevotia chitinilytica TaxID=396808 RepID=UPI000556A5FB|nr:DUF2818 family protein [Andreprevotia chitinilytica]
MLEVVLICILAALAANMPFISSRLLFGINLAEKHFGWRLLEWVVYYLLLGLVARLLEGRISEVHSQHWQFYATTLALFAVMAWPGFVWRYFWRKPGI